MIGNNFYAFIFIALIAYMKRLQMNVLPGVNFCFISDPVAGSFYVPFKKVRGNTQTILHLDFIERYSNIEAITVEFVNKVLVFLAKGR